MKVSDFDYVLPPELIAQTPAQPRDSSKLMVVDRQREAVVETCFFDLPHFLSDRDVLVFNQTKVFPARLLGNKDSGGKVELLLVKKLGEGRWQAMSKPGVKAGQKLFFEGVTFEVESTDSEGLVVGNFEMEDDDLMGLLDEIGYTPLPPYIGTNEDGRDPNVRRNYQTIYAKETGSVAAPTAGFHFTQELLDRLADHGVAMEYVTLHVGLGTFKPVKTDMVEDHQMHAEQYEIKADVAARLKSYLVQGRRIIAVGTTSVRTLESWGKTGQLSGDTRIFIYPGYTFGVVSGMVTNFHLPKSTLLMLVSAFAGREKILAAYRRAVGKKYRFFSFGDAMLIV